MSTRWDTIDLDEYRQTADPEVDKLVADTLNQGVAGRAKYNNLLMLSNMLLEEPGLLFVENSQVVQGLKSYADSDNPTDRALAEYFKPMPAPSWVDTDKLKLASKVWRENTIPALGVLYAASLPFCYLIKNGIPALYDTGKLLPPYLTQRIYETGLMLDAVLDEGGIALIEDRAYDYDSLVLEELNACGAGWTRQGNHFHKSPAHGHQHEDHPALSGQALAETVAQAVAEKLKNPARYLAGKGYLTAKKVRFLHASMRYMLLQPPIPATDPNEPRPLTQMFAEREIWDSAGLGAPVNQEDQAYTLLTFGLIIPKGMEQWGIALSREEKEAFLHLWRLIGHVMGIRDELLTDNWQEAEELFAAVQQRQCGGSQDGVALTNALIGVLQDYLPKVPGMAQNCLPVELIASQIGPKYAQAIIPPDLLKDSKSLWRRPLYAVLGIVSKTALHLSSTWLKRMPLLGQITAGLVHKVGEGVILSWRDAYRREPFFVPKDAETWQRSIGATPEYLAVLKDWRQQVLYTAGFGLALLVLAVFGLTAAVPLWLWQGQTALLIALGVTAGSYAAFAQISARRLNQLLAGRPRPEAGFVRPQR